MRRSAGKTGTVVVGFGFIANNIRAARLGEELFDVATTTRWAVKE